MSNVKALPSPVAVLPESPPSGRALGRRSLSHYSCAPVRREFECIQRRRVGFAAIKVLATHLAAYRKQRQLRVQEAMRCPDDKAVRSHARRQLCILLKYSYLKEVPSDCVRRLRRTLSSGTARALAQTITRSARTIIRRVAPAFRIRGRSFCKSFGLDYVPFRDKIYLFNRGRFLSGSYFR